MSPCDDLAPGEREMTTRQVALVDSAFEEGQYESGIAMLEDLCSPTVHPSKSHVRQLLYIALYPPSHAPTTGNCHKTSQESPSKFSSRHAYSTLLPSPTSSQLAKRTLRVLADVNSPASLLRALPAYPDPTGADDAPPHYPELPSDVDSFVASEAVRFRNCKNCWNILKSGFISSLVDTSSAVPASPRKRTRGNATATKRDHLDEEASSLVVGENAWPVLDWLLVLFEKDELMTEASRQRTRYSPLLLGQIPPTRSDSGSKWDANDPLEVVFHCFEQQDESRRAMGGRLLNLLVNLTSTNLFDLPLFMNLLIPRLPLGASELRDLLFGLSSTWTLCKFKVALCQRYLTRACVGSGVSRGRGRPRAQPRPITARKSASKQGATVPTTPHSKPEIAPLSSNQSQNTLLPAAEILHLLTMKTDASALSKTIKFDLLVTYGILQHQTPAEDKSRDWTEMLQSGHVEEAVRDIFGVSEGDQPSDNTSQRILLRLIATWR
ncbi:hypothetical protein F5148DRAFT_977872 [Russula earlei]|uniref:Uncharacterized protein n=1 Tax=Russula earlei TaxID=71964 RepID=A0ACC0UDR9_9AGAM|nr:hypothetical protein F5148DRAFT_977872 [Russula earlei]